MITPTMIECLDVVHEQEITKLDSTAIVQGIKTSGAIRLRLYFKGKQAKKKGFSVSMDAQQLTESTAIHCLSGSDAKQCMNTFRCSPIDAR